MNDSKPNKGYKVLIVLIYTVVFILGMMLVLKLFVFDKVKEKATEIALEKVLEQAENFGHSIEREYAFLITHSMLHLFGYDHMTPEDEKNMFTKQESVLQYLSILR